MSFKRLDPEDLVVSSDSITSTLWSTDTPTLTTFHTSSAQRTGETGKFYLDVYQSATSSIDAAVQFNIAYCNKVGSGSALYNSIVDGKSPSTTMYGTYRSLILEDENTDFIFGKGSNFITSSDFWAMSIERSRYKESLFPGSLNLTLTGPGGTIQLTDDSQDTLVNTYLGANRVFQLISGSNGTAGALVNIGYVANSGSSALTRRV